MVLAFGVTLTRAASRTLTVELREFEQHVTIEEKRFLIDAGGVVIRVRCGVELDLAQFMG